jgi:hypothetical protein
MHLTCPCRSERGACLPRGAAPERRDVLLRSLHKGAHSKSELFIQVAVRQQAVVCGQSFLSGDGAGRKERGLIEDRGCGDVVQGEAAGEEAAEGVPEQDGVGSGQLQDGRDVVPLPLDGAAGGVPAASVTAAVDGIGGHVVRQAVRHPLPVRSGAEGAVYQDQGATSTRDGHRDPCAVGRGDESL